LNAETACKLRPGKSAQIYRSKTARIATQCRGYVCALNTGRTDAPAACIPRAKFIDHLDHDGTLRLIRPCRKRGLDVEQAYPDAIPKTETESTRLGQQKEERVIKWQEPGFHTRHPVNV